MRGFLSSLAASAFALAVVSASGARAADDIGSAITVNNVVTAELANDKRRLAEGDPVRQNELIEVGDDSLGELKFRDQTKLALGAGSRVVLDKYVYDPDKTAGSIVMNLVRGTFRFITGVAAKPTYQIKTPHASISVRGTIFDVFVEDDGAAWLLLIEGSLRACNARGRCQILDEPGKLIRIDDEGNVGKPTHWKSLPGKRDIRFERAYPFFSRPTRISSDIPDFTHEIVSVGTIPPIIVWPRHPRRPPPYPGDGRWPGGKWPGGKWPGDGKHPGDTKYPGDGKWPGGKLPGDGKTPYPGRDATGGKGTTTSTGKLDGPAILRRLKEGKLTIPKKGHDTPVVRKKTVEVKKPIAVRTHKIKKTTTQKVERVVKHKTTTVKHTKIYKPVRKTSTVKASSFKSSSFKTSTPKSSFGGFRSGRVR